MKALSLFAVALIAVACLVSASYGESGSRPSWACDQVEPPKLDAVASRMAEPIPYKDPGWLFRLAGAFARKHPNAWGSFYFDHSPKGKGDPIYFHVLLTKDVLRHARTIRARAKIPSAFRFSKVELSARELGDLANEVAREQFDQRPPEAYLGYPLIYVAHDESENNVSVGLEDYSPRGARALKEEYGPRFCVQIGDAEPASFLK